MFDEIDEWVPASCIQHYAGEGWFYFGPLEFAQRGFFEQWHDRDPEARRIFAQVYLQLWKHYAGQVGQTALKRD